MAARADAAFLYVQQALHGEYSLDREIGRGGMGIVYRAVELALERVVAIKVLPRELAGKAAIRDRFLREARMAARLCHPNIVPIYRVGERGGVTFFAMAYVGGATLGERLRTTGPLSPAAAARILREVTWAIAHAHRHGIVHRDIKPENILLEDETGRALVADFGIAQSRQAYVDSFIGGTHHFASPEQARGDPVDVRSDLYSLGVVAHLALTGVLPDRESRNSLPPHLRDAVFRCLAERPEDRYQCAEDLAEALEAVEVSSRPALPVPLRTWVERRDPMTGFYIAWFALFGVVTVGEIRGGTGAEWVVAAVFALLPLVPALLSSARAMYRTLAAGYDLRDLRYALATWRAERHEQLRYELGDREPVWAHGLRVAALTGGAGALAAFQWMPRTRHGITVDILLGGVLLLAAGGTLAMQALGVPFFGRRTKLASLGVLRSWLWNSRAGQWLVRLLGPRRRARSAKERPTVPAIAGAIEDLYEQLPNVYQRHLGNLPSIVARLEKRAVAAQTATRWTTGHKAKDAFGHAVSALETIRIGLLRLHGGSTDLEPLTTLIEEALEVSDDIASLAEAQFAVRDELRPRQPSDGLTPSVGISTPAS